MSLDLRALCGHRRRVDIVDHLHRVRIPHRKRSNHDLGVRESERLRDVLAVADEGNVGGRKSGRAHGDRHISAGLQARLDNAPQSFDADGALGRHPPVVNETHEAPGAVAALLDLAAVTVENAVAKVDSRARRSFDDQDLVATDAETTIGEASQLGRAQIDALSDAVEHDEVIAQALHLGELESMAHRRPPRSSATVFCPRLVNGSARPSAVTLPLIS